MNLRSTLSVLCFTLCSVIITEQCSKGYPFEHYLGTRTPYRMVSNHSLHKVNFEGCTPKKIWMVVRHGTRNPSDKRIEAMNIRLPEIKELILNSDSLPNEYIKHRDLDLFRKWKSTLDIRDENKLTHEGEEEMLLLAERMQSRLPEIFDNVYSNTSYKFKYTYSQRTKKSAYYFAAGLFGKKTAKDVWFPEPSKRDPILRFYKLCDKWKKDVKETVKESGEHRKFENTEHIQKVVDEVTERLGLENKLSVDDISIMYQTCGFETAWNKKSKSPWCSPFTEDNLKVLEYMEDLRYYWQDGYGYDLSYKQACPAFGDMIAHFDNISDYPKATLYFTHSGTLLKMLAHLGLYKDAEPLTADKYDAMSERKWKTSLIDSFGTNLAFVLYDCDTTKKVLTLHQENIVRLPCCPDQDLCDYKQITDHYNRSIQSCDFVEMCDSSATGSDSE
ncbi:multiple inositol polyphosphate phosphatase 1 [Anthonomus grandis grandis]|uniref:multiple inositol polyphosphate phosphatase 1 n=1 Tax=Anthonomus grandis grandis TaxID=2921223 RepID=UPI0021652CDA|nr:multiple inositol polyphosphate phosphatase 1 [Anthonomus grandis grandis]